MIHSENRLAPRMVLIITNHEYRRKLEQTFQNFRIPIYYQCQGYGTAPSEMLDIFGLSGSGRLLTIGLLPKFLVRDLLDALQQLGLALHFSLDLPQCFKDIVQNEFFHDGGASLYFHYDIINPQPEQRLLRRRLYPVFPDKNPYYAEQDCK